MASFVSNAKQFISDFSKTAVDTYFSAAKPIEYYQTHNVNGFSGRSGSFSNSGSNIVGTAKAVGDLFGYDTSGLSTIPSSDLFSSGGSSSGGSYYASSASYSAPSTPQQLEYIDAPLAEQYGMDATTAYQEALSNTAMRRHMNDLKAAGLNPVLGMSGSGSGGVYSATPLAVDSGGSSTGGAYGSAGSGKTTADMKETAKSLSYWLPTLVNGVATGVVTLRTGNGMTGFGAGQVAQNVTSGILNAIRNS